MDIQEYLSVRLTLLHQFHLIMKGAFSAHVFGIVLDIRSGNPWESVLYILHDTKEQVKWRRMLEKSGNADQNSTSDKWSHDAIGIFWLPPEVDHLHSNHKGIALRDEYLTHIATQDASLLYRALVDLCARVLRRFHEDQVATQPSKDRILVVLEILGNDSALNSYAQDQGFQATPEALQDQYLAILNVKKHALMIENGVNYAFAKITLANKIAKELTEHVAKCRALSPIPTLSELSPVERSQYNLIRAKLEEWLPKAHRIPTYLLEVFDTCRPGLTAFHDLVNPKASTIFFMTTDEYRQYQDIEHNDERDIKLTIEHRWHKFEQRDLSKAGIEPSIDYGSTPILTTYPIPKGNQYWIESYGSNSGYLCANGRTDLWQSNDTEMIQITGLSYWVS